MTVFSVTDEEWRKSSIGRTSHGLHLCVDGIEILLGNKERNERPFGLIDG